tara:strand:- start:19 stop:279 length:261 start_codon:yes stop_codon:yes gene_type:complete
MTTQIELQRARQIVEHNKTFVLDSISKKYADLFKAIEDYNYISINGTETEEQEISVEINYLLQELNIKEDDARNMFDEYQVQKEEI